MSHTTIDGRARYLGPAAGLVHAKDDHTIVEWEAPADLYLLTPPLHGYTVAVAAISLTGNCYIIGLEGEGLLIDWHDIAGDHNTATAAQALAAAGYTITT